jgi:2-polyprenyl-3-methyl-5-hydroxy-6-metoxy-1,4-benzoquinol methylase
MKKYEGTYEYYAKYRPDIPKEVINLIINHFNLELNDRILDIGCGTGKVSLAIDGKCAEMICIDPDLEMLEWAKKVTKDSKAKLTWLNYSDKDLGKLKKELGIFKIATICRAFHWMNQDQTLKDLDDLINEDGGIAILSDKGFWSGEDEWQKTIKRITQKYVGEKKNNGEDKFKSPERPWNDILAHSTFKFIKTYEVPTIRDWDIESIIGCVFSYSSATPYLFGNQIDKFKEEIKNALLSIKPKGKFQENSIWSVVLASKKPL